MKNKISYLLAASFLTGYIANDIVGKNKIKLFSDVHAEVAGMNYYELINDNDFRKAVMTIAEDECKTDIKLEGKVKTWFSCGENSRHDPRAEGYELNYNR